MHECIGTEESNTSSTGVLHREPELSSLWADFLSESERDLEETQKDLEDAKSKLQDTRQDLQDRKNELRVQTELFQGLRTLDGSRAFISSEHERIIFPALPQEERAEGTESRPLRICIVSPEFVGPFRCGGIGTFYTELGKVLAGAGHHVTFLFSRRDYCEIRTVEYWIEHYRDQGIRFEPIRACPLKVSIPEHQAIPYDVYYWLKDRNFDIIHFPELSGVGYYSLLAKKQGLGFSRTLMCVGTHSPSLWCRFANQEDPGIMWDIELDFMERQSAALADVVWSPSQYLLNWLLEQGWKFPESAYVQPLIMPPPPGHSIRTDDLGPRPVNKFVFFGRLETRKGVSLFCDALDRLTKEKIEDLEITFLGRHAIVYGEGSAEYISRRSEKWPWPCRVVDNLNQPDALQYLQREGVMAVMASPVDNSPNTVYECLALGIPFIACRSGGIPELIDERDLDDVSFPYDADALAAKYKEVLKGGLMVARPAIDMSRNTQAWVGWHERHGFKLAQQEKLPEHADSSPMVSVCLAHSNRPNRLLQAVASLEGQYYPNFEVILVDDNSTEPEALACLDELEPLFAKRGWRVVRRQARCQGDVWNAAASHARGEYLLFMDSDDVAKPHELTVFVKAALNGGADILTCCCDRFAGDDPPGNNRTPERWVPLGSALIPSLSRNWFGRVNALVRKEVFNTLRGFAEEYTPGCEDWEFFARAVLSGFKLDVIPQALYWNRTSGDGNGDHACYHRVTRPYTALMPEYLRHLVPFAQGLGRFAQQLRTGKDNELRGIADHYREVIAVKDGTTRSRALKDLGQAGKAAALLQQVWRQARNSPNLTARLESLLEIGNLQVELGQPDAAVAVLFDAQKTAKELRNLTMLEQIGILIDKLRGRPQNGR